MDRQTFDRLVLEHLYAAQRFAGRLTGRAEEAEEVVQNALVRASRGWKTFGGRSAFRTWFFQIIVHEWRDHTERRSRRRTDPLETDLPDKLTNDPPSLAAAAELGRAVAEAISGLPPRQREVIVLHTYEQLSDDEIAAVLSITAQDARTTLHLGRQRLRQILRPYLDVASDER